jgi:hypothetical protein
VCRSTCSRTHRASAAAGLGPLLRVLLQLLGIPIPISAPSPHLCSIKCHTHPCQRSRPCGEKLPAFKVWRAIHIDAREPRKARQLPHTFTAVGVETPPNVDQLSNKKNAGPILLSSPDPLACIPLRREEGQKGGLGGTTSTYIYLLRVRALLIARISTIMPNESNFPTPMFTQFRGQELGFYLLERFSSAGRPYSIQARVLSHPLIHASQLALYPGILILWRSRAWSTLHTPSSSRSVVVSCLPSVWCVLAAFVTPTSIQFDIPCVSGMTT